MGAHWSPYRDAPDLTGKVAVVTGANAGMGLYTALHLALHGAKVYIGARTEAKANQAQETILALQPSIAKSQLPWLQLDLSMLGSVINAVEKLKSTEHKISILVNNAGVATKDVELTDAGWEMAMAVSHVGHFTLTNCLLPLLKNAASEKGADVRVVTITSGAHSLFFPSDYQFDFSNADFLRGKILHEPWRYRFLQKPLFNISAIHYGMAKLVNVLFAQELQRCFDDIGIPITSMSVDPGAVKSDGGVGVWIKPIQPIMERLMTTPDEGSFNALFAATASEVWRKPEVYKGSYLVPVGRVGQPHIVAQDEKHRRALWDTTTNEVDQYLKQHGFAPLNEL